MSDQSLTSKEIKEACQIIAEHVNRFRPNRHSQEWIKRQILEILLNQANVELLSEDYLDEYAYADVQNSYLVEILKQYDQEA
jgi:hypothetical protein